MTNNKLTTKEMVQLALTVAALIAGGYVLYFIGVIFPIPGFKYLILTPYLSFIITFVILYFKNPRSFFYFNTTFGMIMSLMNIYMGLAILSVGIITQIFISILPKKWPFYNYIISFIYAESVIYLAVFVSAFILQLPLYDHMNLYHLMLLGTIGGFTSFFGGNLGITLVNRLPKKIKN